MVDLAEKKPPVGGPRYTESMVSFLQIELACLAAATVFETALLLALTDRRNWSRVPLPIVLLVLGAWLWHAGSLTHLALTDATGAGATVRGCCSLAMAGGLLLIPSAMLHGLIRLTRTGLACRLQPDPRHGLLYLPLLLLLPIGADLLRAPQASFLQALDRWIAPYAVWLAIVNVLTAVGMLRLQEDPPSRHAGRFLRQVACILFALAVFEPWVLLYGRTAWPSLAPGMLLMVSLTPAVLAVLFAYFVSQFNVMRLVLERSIVYGMLLLAAWLVHQILFSGLRAQLRDHYRLDLEIVEVLLLVALVLAYSPARRRTAEALRYLFGSRVDRVRQRLRTLSVELAGHVGRPPEETLAWFAGQLRDALEVQYAAIQPTERSIAPHVAAGELSPEQAAHWQSSGPLWCDALRQSPDGWATRRTARIPAILDALHDTSASLMLLLSAGGFEGLLLVGRRSRNRHLSEEETIAVVLLSEQLAAALTAGRLLAERAQAEQRAMQNERLTLLGLLASSIAHEVKNPLSSIRTIAAVLSETLGPESPHAEDLRLITSEADRLSTSVQQLLAVVRPRPGTGPVQAGMVLDRTLDLVRFVARERGVTLAAQIDGNLRPVEADEAALREIFLNLLTNSIDAAGERGAVQVECRQQNGHVVAWFRDNGPGLSDEVRNRLFQPFVTTKPEGTGLGLFVTSRRVEQCGGEISCESVATGGTCFMVKLPCAASTDASDSL